MKEYYIHILQFALIYTFLLSLMATGCGLITPMANRYRYKLEMKIDIVHSALQSTRHYVEQQFEIRKTVAPPVD